MELPLRHRDKDIRSGEGGGYTEIKGSLKGPIKIIRSSTGKILLSQDSELKKNTFNTVIIYGSLSDTKHSLKMLFHSVERDVEEAGTLRLLNCIDFFEVSVALGSGRANNYPLAEWQTLPAGPEVKSLLLSFMDDKKQTLQISQQLLMEPGQEYWILLTPNPHPKAFHRPRVTLIHESKARAEALEPPVEEPEPNPSTTPIP